MVSDVPVLPVLPVDIELRDRNRVTEGNKYIILDERFTINKYVWWIVEHNCDKPTDQPIDVHDIFGAREKIYKQHANTGSDIVRGRQSKRQADRQTVGAVPIRWILVCIIQAIGLISTQTAWSRTTWMAKNVGPSSKIWRVAATEKERLRSCVGTWRAGGKWWRNKLENFDKLFYSMLLGSINKGTILNERLFNRIWLDIWLFYWKAQTSN